MIPEAIATVASVMQIIDYIGRFSRYISQDEALILTETLNSLAKLDPRSSARVADDILRASIKKSIPAPQSAFVTDHLSTLTTLTGYVVAEVDQSRQAKRLPRYGPIATVIAAETVRFLDHWGCFDSMGETFEFPWKNSWMKKGEYAKTIAARSVRGPVLSAITGGSEVSKQQASQFRLVFILFSPLAKERIVLAHGPRSTSPEIIRLDGRKPYGLSIGRGSDYSVREYGIAGFEWRDYNVDTLLFEQIVTGIIEDYLWFSREVGKRVASSSTFLDSLTKRLLDEDD